MNKVWECIIDVFIGILIMFVSVAVYFGLRTESVIKSMYEGITEEFVADVKRNGVLTLDEYESYMERMGTGNSLFNISFEHRYKIYEPEYRFKTLEEILEDQNNAYKGSNDYHYWDVITDRPPVDDPINDGNLNTETNESILAKAVNNPADPNHVHTDDCYKGHRHTGEPTNEHIHSHTYPECREYRERLVTPGTCTSCRTVYDVLTIGYWWDEESKTAKYEWSYEEKYCPSCGYTGRNLGEQITYYGYSCGFYESSTEKTPYNEPYVYILSYPAGKARTTYTNGCYTYHKEQPKYNTSLRRDFAGEYIYSSIAEMYKFLTASNFQGFCELPYSFALQLIHNDGNPSEADTVYQVSYKTIHDTVNDEIIFQFQSHWIKYSDRPGGEWHYDNPGYPEILTGAEFAELHEYGKFYQFVKNSGVNPRGVSEYYKKTRPDWSRTTISVCSYDHETKPVNKWYFGCGLDEDGTLDCDKIITSLVPTHTEQTIYVNDPLITTAVATYEDGSTKTVVCTTDFTTSVIGKKQSIILEYSYLIDGLTYTKTCVVEVTVISRNKTCLKGHIYNLNDDGTDPGCPYCREWVESLRVINPTTSPIVITIGTTLQENDVRLLATYMDGHIEEVTSEYIDNFDTGYLGTKPVTIGYKGASVTILVTTVCATMICDLCGYEYNLYPDGTNPGCPRCIQKIPIFTGNIMVYEHINHTEEILDILYKKKKYIFNIDDVFSVSVYNKSSSIARRLLRKIYPSITDKWLNIEKKEHVMSK